MSTFKIFDQVLCPYSNVCSGCAYIDYPYGTQIQKKEEALRQAWRSSGGFDADLHNLKIVEVDASALRDRVDLVIDNSNGVSRIGLFDQTHREIVDISSCAQLSPNLQSWHEEFRKLSWPIKRGSVRLRVGPSNEGHRGHSSQARSNVGTNSSKFLKGAWLDFANTDIKDLLEARSVLDQLRSMAVVEIGQKRKRLVEVEGRLKLSEPVPEAWFETYVGGKFGHGPGSNDSSDMQQSDWATNESSRAIPLYCTVGSFTQPGFRANRALIGEVNSQLAGVDAKVVAEFGSGIGNFTLPLASRFSSVHTFEVDALANLGLRRSAEEAGLTSRIVIHEGNFQVGRKSQETDFSQYDLVVVDPPRSGLMSFLDPLTGASAKPHAFLYVSCFAESFAADAARLRTRGFSLRSIALVDQFPQSPHFEIVALFGR